MGDRVKGGALLPFRSPRARGKPATFEEIGPPPREDLSDEALVAACATGDTAALAALFDRHHAVVFRFVSRIASASASDVEDLAQSTFLEMWRSSPRFRQSGSARSWILGIAANLVKHYVRGEVRRRAAMADLAGHPDRGGCAGRPDDLAAQNQMMVRLAAALDALPHDLRVAFVLCDVEEVPGVEAARALGVRQGTMWRRLHDARKRLRDMMGGRPPHEGSAP
ncbi:MAG TPA: RNA polymerase sigma factor [Kofleriaceae bacterium]|nr:RNA polymerase sigma factor [Kofleriaceae bacterium]